MYALRTARPRQLRARALRPLRRRRFAARPRPAVPQPLVANEPLWRSRAFDRSGAAPDSSSRLALFHAHYGDDVLEAARTGDAATAHAATAAWTRSNPPSAGDAWHPYPLSTRIGNWIAALTLEPTVQESVAADSLWRQLEYLASNVENDTLGNHVIRNAKALLLGGAAFQDQRLMDLGQMLLARELPEQVLADGGHYERSPAYHRLVLRDLLEVAPFADVSAVLSQMQNFAAATSRPDGAPALFNDGGLDVAPHLDLPPPPPGTTVLPDSGYAVVRRGELWLAFRCGPLAPSFLPAHAHADALSFQLWWSGRPVIVDPGMPTYEAGPERDRFRGTAAHSTVAVGGDQFELWGAFRSGPLPRVELVTAGDDTLIATASYRGVRHRRSIEIAKGAIDIRDRIEGHGTMRVIAALPLAPDASIDVEAYGPLPARQDGRVVAERLGERVPSRAWVLDGTVKLPVELGWRILLRPEPAGG